MKKKGLIIGLLVFIRLGMSAQPAGIKTDTKITDVTVYTSGARIFAEKRVDVPAGTSTVRFTGISSELDTESIQVSAEGAVTILSVNHELDYLSEKEQSPEVKGLIKQRDVLRKNLDKEKMQLEILDKEMQFMTVNMKVTGTNATAKVAELAPVFDFFSSKITALTREISWRNDSVKSWTEQITKINNQIGDLMAQMKTPAGVIAVNLDAPARTGVLLKVNYVIRNAGWYPTYDIRVKNIESPVQVTYKVNMFQHSGNDWKDVNLRFSSANPAKTGILPELTPWWLNIQPPQPRLMIRGNSSLIKEKAANLSVQEEKAEAPAMLSVVAEEAGTAVEFVVEKLFSVPSTGKNFQIDVSTVSLPALYSYISIPKIDPVAHLKARLTGWEQLNLMPGEANVYFEGSFTGKTYLNTKDFSDTLEISLGIDRNISIQRTMEKELSSTRFLASKTEAAKGWKLSVRNNKSQKIEITLMDQIPLSANSDIEVNNTSLSGGKLDPATGEVSWNMEVKPAEKAEKKLSYTVRYPKGKKINLE